MQIGYIPVTLTVKKHLPKGNHEKDEPGYVWEEFGFNLCNMSTWKPYTGEDDAGKPMLMTMLYMEGNPKGIVLQLNGEAFLKKCKEAVSEWSKFMEEIKGGN